MASSAAANVPTVAQTAERCLSQVSQLCSANLSPTMSAIIRGRIASAPVSSLRRCCPVTAPKRCLLVRAVKVEKESAKKEGVCSTFREHLQG